MKFDIKKTIQCKYIQYRLEKDCRKNPQLERLSQEEKERICIEATRKTKKFLFVCIPIYLTVAFLFNFFFIFNPTFRDNAFVIWYQGILNSIDSLANGSWGGTMNRKKGTFLLIYIKLIPILIIYAAPLFGPMLIMANRFLKKEYSLYE